MLHVLMELISICVNVCQGIQDKIVLIILTIVPVIRAIVMLLASIVLTDTCVYALLG